MDYNALEPIGITFVDEENLSYFTPFIPETLLNQLTTDPMTMAMGAVSEKIACGALVFAVEEPLVRLLSIAVAPDYRRQGIGSTLFGELVDFLELSGEFDVDLLQVDFADRKDGMKAFLSSLGCNLESDWAVTVSVPLQKLREQPFGNASSPPAGYVYLPLEELSAYHLKQLNALLEEDGADFIGLPIGLDTMDARVSIVCYQQEKPVGCICFSGNPEGELTLTAFYIGKQSPEFVYGLLRNAVQKLDRWGSDRTVIKIPLVQPSALRLAKSLLGDLGDVCETMCHAQLSLTVMEDFPMSVS